MFLLLSEVLHIDVSTMLPPVGTAFSESPVATGWTATDDDFELIDNDDDSLVDGDDSDFHCNDNDNNNDNSINDIIIENAIPPNPYAKPYAETLGSYTTYMVAVLLCHKETV